MQNTRTCVSLGLLCCSLLWFGCGSELTARTGPRAEGTVDAPGTAFRQSPPRGRAAGDGNQLNLRSGPGTSYAVLASMPQRHSVVEVLSGRPAGFQSPGAVRPAFAAATPHALCRKRRRRPTISRRVGRGLFVLVGPELLGPRIFRPKGSCSGSCRLAPNGTYGADCSGYVARSGRCQVPARWRVQPSYSTYPTSTTRRARWRTVARGSAKQERLRLQRQRGPSSCSTTATRGAG